jgi:hypothetical protein
MPPTAPGEGVGDWATGVVGSSVGPAEPIKSDITRSMRLGLIVRDFMARLIALRSGPTQEVVGHESRWGLNSARHTMCCLKR